MIQGTYELEGLETVGQLRRVLTIAAVDLLGLENSVARARALIAVVGIGAKLLEVGELEERVARLEAALVPSTPHIGAWCTLEGEPVAPPAQVIDRVDAEARALGLPGAWRCAVWLPDEALAFLVGEREGEVQVVEV